jgi:hypothetical protein
MTPSDRSARAIKALQQQSEHGNSNYLDQLASVSMTLEGKILVDLLPKIYDRPGRVVRIVGEDDSEGEVTIGAPNEMGDMSMMPDAQGAPPQQPVDLTLGQYSVVVAVGKSYATRREEQNDMIGQLITAAPQMAPVISDLWVGSMDFPASRAIAERLHKMLPPQLQSQGGGQPPLPPQVQQQMQQAQQTIEQLQQQMQEMAQKIETKQLELEAKAQMEERKIQAKMEMEAQERASRERIEEMKAQVAIADAGARSATAQRKAETDAMMRQTELMAKQRHDGATQFAQQRHDAAMQTAKEASTTAREALLQANEPAPTK